MAAALKVAMMRTLVPILVTVLGSACSAHAGEAPSRQASTEPAANVVQARAGGPPRVFVEVLLVEIADPDLGLLGEKSFAEIATSPKITVLMNPNLLAIDHRLAEISMRVPSAADPSRLRGPGQEQHWTVKADVLGHDELRLELVAFVGGGGATAEAMRVVVVMADGQRTIVKTALPARENHMIVAVVRPDILRSENDLRRVYERKMRERARSVDATVPRAGGRDS